MMIKNQLKDIIRTSLKLNEAVVSVAKSFNLKTEFLSQGNKDNHIELYKGYIKSLNETNWEFFYLGGLERRIKPRPKYNRLSNEWQGEFNEEYDYIMECSSVGWAHSFAVNGSIFERIVSDYDNNIWDVLVEKHDSHLDRYYQEILKPKTYVCVPSLTTQYNLVSDLTRTRTNRNLRLNPKDNI